MPQLPVPKHTLFFFLAPALLIILLGASSTLKRTNLLNLHQDNLHPRTPNVQNLSNIKSSNVSSLAIPFGQKNYSPSFTITSTQSLRNKRAPEPILSFEEARCRGAQVWAEIQRVYESPVRDGPYFDRYDYDTTWTSRFDPPRLGEAFESWYRQIGAGNPADAVVNATTSIQDKSYTDVSGDDDS
ncbi:MAG: hypothetical protein Q9174_004510, partial [Haloplaca sp. 1 TL-2023]